MLSNLWRTERGQTHGHAQGQTDRQVKTEGPKIMSSDCDHCQSIKRLNGKNYKHENKLLTYILVQTWINQLLNKLNRKVEQIKIM